MSRRKLVFANNPLLSGPALEDRVRIGIPYRELPIELIDTDPNQPRVNFDDEKLNELAQSIRIYGVLSPVLVRPGRVSGRYTIISGERRLRAARIAGLGNIPALVNDTGDSSDGKTLAIQLVENLQRADLTPLERAHAIAALKETHSLSIRDVAERLGTSKAMVQRSLEILQLPDDLLNALREGASESKILLLAKIEDPGVRASYLKDLDVFTRSRIKRDLEVKIKREGHRTNGTDALNAEDERIADELRRSLGLKVTLSRFSKEGESGRLAIDFYSNDDLQDLFRRLIAN